MWKEVKAACETAKKERTAVMQETLERARIYFHVCPGNLDALPPAFLNQVDGAFLKVFAPLLGRTGGSDTASWRKAHLAYMTQVGGILNEYIARPTSTMIPVPARASVRMCSNKSIWLPKPLLHLPTSRVSAAANKPSSHSPGGKNAEWESAPGQLFGNTIPILSRCSRKLIKVLEGARLASFAKPRALITSLLGSRAIRPVYVSFLFKMKKSDPSCARLSAPSGTIVQIGSLSHSCSRVQAPLNTQVCYPLSIYTVDCHT
jgi:hypothetical protein